MSEGEFKNQGKLFDLIFIQSTYYSQHPLELSINEEALKQIIKEAKKEFPTRAKWLVKESWASGSYLEERVNRERDEWFKEWFGDLKDE